MSYLRNSIRSLLLPVAAMGLASDAAIAASANACTVISAAAKKPLLRVPFSTVDGRIYAEARVNGQGPFRFAVDTGASGAGRIDASLTRELDLPLVEATRSSDGLASRPVDQVRVGTLDLGGYTQSNLTLITRDYRSRMSAEAAFSGILGRDFFGDGLLVIDYPNRTIMFSRRAGLTPAMQQVLPYERAFRVPIMFGSKTVTGNIDTGANVTFVIPKGLYAEVSQEPLRPAPAGTLMNSSITTEHGRIKGPIQIGGASFAEVDVRVSEQFPEVLIGAHALQNQVLLIDQRTKLIALCPHKPTRSRSR